MENLQTFLDQMKIEMANQTADIISRIDEKLAPLTQDITDLRNENQILREKINKIDTYNRQNNIIIYGLRESEKSSFELLENVTEKIKTDLNIPFEKRDIDVIYRIGKKDTKNEKIRPILIKLANNWMRNEIMVNKKKLKDAYASEDYTKEVMEKRRELIPKLKEERIKGNFAILKNDKLIIKEGNTATEKRKRNESISPETSRQPRKQFVSSKINRINAFDVMRGRSNSMSGTIPASENQK